MAKPLSLSQARKRAYDKTRASLLRQGASKDVAAQAARELAASEVSKLERKRERDREYRRKVREAEKVGAPHDVALEAGRLARAEFVSRTERARPELAGIFPGELRAYKRPRGSLTFSEMIPAPAIPARILEQLPDVGDEFWRKNYTVSTALRAQFWTAIIFGRSGRVIDQSVRLLTLDDAISNAVARAELPTNSRKDRRRSALYIWVALVPLVYSE